MIPTSIDSPVGSLSAGPDDTCWCGDEGCATSEETLHCTDDCPDDCTADHGGER